MLPESGDHLASLEWWLWIAAVAFGVLAPASGLIAYQIGQHRGRLERAAAEREESTRKLIEAAKKAKSAEPQPAPVARQITADQQEKLVAALSGKKGVKVIVAFGEGDGEGQQFALEITNVLKTSGWDVEGPAGGTWAPNNPIGQGIVVKDGNSPPSGAIPLWGAFTDAGIQMGAMAKPETPDDQIWIIVGTRA